MGEKKGAQASKEHIEKYPKCKSVLTRNSTYRRDTTGVFTEGSGWWWQSHHIACDHAVSGREIDNNEEYVENCLWITDWNLNNPDNLIGLPTNRQHRKLKGKNPENMCSHQVDHNTTNGYTDECKQWLKDNVWDSLNKEKKTHEVNAEAIKKQLEECTRQFKQRLVDRGNRDPGTKDGMKFRFKKHKNTWYYPFSMADDPFVSKRHPGVDFESLINIFKKIG